MRGGEPERPSLPRRSRFARRGANREQSSGVQGSTEREWRGGDGRTSVAEKRVRGAPGPLAAAPSTARAPRPAYFARVVGHPQLGGPEPSRPARSLCARRGGVSRVGSGEPDPAPPSFPRPPALSSLSASASGTTRHSTRTHLSPALATTTRCAPTVPPPLASERRPPPRSPPQHTRLTLSLRPGPTGTAPSRGL